MVSTCVNEEATVRKWARWVKSAPVSAVASGASWYEVEGGGLIRDMQAVNPSLSVGVCAKAIAILSANNSWRGNRTCALRWASGAYPDSGGSFAMANLLLEDPSSVVGLGAKTEPFYRALVGDTGAIVVDLWMMRAVSVLRGRKRRAQPATSDVSTVGRVCRAVALRTGTEPRDVQAIVWGHVRGSFR